MKRLLCAILLVTLLLYSCEKEETISTSIKEQSLATAITTEESDTVTEAPYYPPATPAADFSYEENDDGGITIRHYKGNDTSFVVPKEIDGKPVTEIWFLNVLTPDFVNDTIVSVTLPDTIKSIGNTTFQNFTALESINLPDSLTEIGNHAFAYCTSLKNISIPGGAINEYSWNAFMYSGLETVEIRGDAKIIPSGIFGGTNIKEFVCPDSVEEIEFQAFSGCANLEKLVLNEGLITVGSHLLSGTNVKEIVIPSTVEEITESAFENTPDLEKVIFNGDAPNAFIDDYISAYGTSFTVYYNEKAQGFTYPYWHGYPSEIIGHEQPRLIDKDYEYIENESGVTILRYLGADTEVTIPETINGKAVTTIGERAFAHNGSIKSIQMPNTVTSIEFRAFDACYELTYVKLSDNLYTIGACAFFACFELEDIALPDTLIKLGDMAFSNCTSLTSINIPESITEMGEGVFSFSGIK